MGVVWGVVGLEFSGHVVAILAFANHLNRYAFLTSMA